MAAATVDRILARASLAQCGDELDRAAAWAAAGDADWQLWLDDIARGLALKLEVDIVVEVLHCGRRRRRIRTRDSSMWVEKHVDPPKVEEQVRQIVGTGFPAIVGDLRTEGLEISERDLDDMYVHIELDRAVREAIATPPMLGRGQWPRPRSVAEPPC